MSVSQSSKSKGLVLWIFRRRDLMGVTEGRCHQHPHKRLNQQALILDFELQNAELKINLSLLYT